MDVILAEHSGFCFGVEKAIQRARQELASQDPKAHPVYSLGPLIHNRQVVDSLESKGLNTIESVDDATGGTIIIRSHGVPEATYQEIKSQQLRLVDTTCPFVKKIQTIVRDHYHQGHTIVIIGNASHPEVIGINGWCNNQAIVINTIEELNQIPENITLCVVAQTTLQVSLYKTAREKLNQRHQTIHWYNTICLATQERQQAASELANKVDAMVVIGGAHSSNTQKLALLCSEILPGKTYLIEKQTDLPFGLLSCENRVGVTAGASTPIEVIEETIAVLKAIKPGDHWQIAIDGPAGAGKSTIAKKLAQRLHFMYIDTGAMYRAFTDYVLKSGISLTDENAIISKTHQMDISLHKGRIFVNNMDVTHEIRSQKVTAGVSTVASIKEVRKRMVELQQAIAAENHVVMDGRDIGTVVLPNADLKIYLTASVEERARRRYEELKGESTVTFEQICQQIKERDYTDEHREHDPLIPANDAVQIDTTSLSIEEVVEKITLLFCKKIKSENLS
ncbi:MAG: 4-hydroxy-3-methylbut-2-enyl diphosphate reductase [Bacillota bacterium]|nr:4-hydroxy-3-methylbut-2-enyl diphosphate reductase [Bacillota bacterium]MDW7676024.1 4-hydroxy-3-methylbut-2-enyl diphosphate reductase [Bacillota bacterium]